MRAILTVLATVLLAFALPPADASATSGFGCYSVNVGPNDPLRIRASPNARSAAVAGYHWGNQPIIALSAPSLRGEGRQPSLFEVHQAEFDVCVPSNLPLGARWCPVSFFDGDTTGSGWIKRRFVDHSECP